MAILEKFTPDEIYDELILLEVISNPVMCGEFIENIEMPDSVEPFEFTYYQQEFICDFNTEVSICCARAVGKTVSLKHILIWYLVNDLFADTLEEYVLFTVPNEVHLEPVWDSVTRSFRANEFLQMFLPKSSGINSSSYQIKTLIGTQLRCRIAGTKGDGRNVNGLHTAIIVLDEAGFYPHGTYLELDPVRNKWITGSRVVCAGVPTGFRENNVLFEIDMQSERYSKHRITAHENPRYSEKDEQDNIEKYKGTDTDEYIHFVLGRHGKPTYALFDREQFNFGKHNVYKIKLNGLKIGNDLSGYMDYLISMPSVPGNRPVYIGADLGYSEPTAIVIAYIDNHEYIVPYIRLQLTKVAYPIQSKIIDWLDTKYRPVMWGIDEGSVGKSEIQRFKLEAQYAHKNYTERMYPVAMQGNLELGLDLDGNPVTEKTKPYATKILQEYSNTGKIMYSHKDIELVEELERMVYVKTASGQIVYRTLTAGGGKSGADHFTAAMLCLVTVYNLQTEGMINTPEQSIQFVTPFWG
jgi:hypothetical protein